MTVTIDPVPRWSREVAQLRAQARKIRRGSSAKDAEVAEAALETCDSLLRDLAGAQLECERLQAKVQTEMAIWERLFDVMPRASLLTDSAGYIVKGNSAAGALLNVSARHLKDRQLLVFTRDRDAFRVLLQRMGDGREAEVQGSLGIRPRERRPVPMDVRVVPLSPGAGMWLWFFVPAEEAATQQSGPEGSGLDADTDSVHASN